MLKLTPFLAFFIIVGNLISQHDQGVINVRIGGNAALGATFVNGTVFGQKAEEDTGAVLATQIPFSIEYGITNFLSVNAGFRTGSWLNEDPNDNDVVIIKKRITSGQIGFKLYAVNKENFNLYASYDFGFGGFQTEKENKGFFLVNEKQKWSGTNNNINLGMNWYYGGNFGSYFQMGYAGYNFNLKEYSLNNEDQMRPYEIEANMKVKGFQMELGFCYRFNN